MSGLFDHQLNQRFLDKLVAEHFLSSAWHAALPHQHWLALSGALVHRCMGVTEKVRIIACVNERWNYSHAQHDPRRIYLISVVG